MIDAATLPRLLQLASPTLPVGAFSYSQGLEWAVETGVVHDQTSADEWIGAVMRAGIAGFEAPLVARLYRAFRDGDAAAVAQWDERFVTARETAELRAETLQMGYSLTRLLSGLDGFPADHVARLEAIEGASFPAAYACAAAAWNIPLEAALTAYLWAWLENQVMAALKSVPLGQAAGQALLLRLGADIAALAARAAVLEDDELSNFAPGLAIASSRHETQYSRLFRS
ncbi:MAG TPA: urease accessory protein UreF [Burkholderiales bacterium]|nr:urease accessory protein UreF [Burkholderiales bacterium]